MKYRCCKNCFWYGVACFFDKPNICKDHIRMDDLRNLPKYWGNPINHTIEASANKLREINKYY